MASTAPTGTITASAQPFTCLPPCAPHQSARPGRPAASRPPAPALRSRGHRLARRLTISSAAAYAPASASAAAVLRHGRLRYLRRRLLYLPPH
jgi:hypothetical protein